MTVLVLALLAAVVLSCWVLWLNRYVIYTRDGAKLDFNLSPTLSEGNAAVPPVPGKPVDIVYQEDLGIEDPEDNVLKPLKGFYADTADLKADPEKLQETLVKLSAGTAVMVDVRNVRSEFYYPTSLGKNLQGLDPETFAAMVKELKKTDHYLVARLPAFREYYYILDDEDTRVAFGLPRAGGNGALWLDETGPNYWMNPISDGTLSHLVQIVAELKAMGFDEVVFTDFCFPPTEDILYEGDKTAVLNETAEHLVYNLATDTFCVSFLCDVEGFRLPEGRTRLYREKVDASMAQSVASTLQVPNTQINLVYLTETKDTRFDLFGALRPLPLGLEALPPVDQPPAEQPQEPEQPQAPAQTVSLGELRQKVVELAAKSTKMKDAVREIVKSFAPQVMQIPEDKIPEVWDKLEALEQGRA